MKQVHYNIAVFFLVGTSICFSSKAQESLYKTDMTIEKEYSPVLQDVAKINRMPEVEPVQPPSSSIEYIEKIHPFSPKGNYAVLDPAMPQSESQKSPYKGLARLALGYPWTIQGDLWYDLISSHKRDLSFSVGNRSSFLNPITLYQNGKNTTAERYTTTATLQWKERFSRFDLTSGIRYQHSYYNFYGYDSLTVPATIVSYQSLHNLDVYSGFCGSVGKIDYSVRLAYGLTHAQTSPFVGVPGNTEHQIALEGSFLYRTQKRDYFQLDLSLKGLIYGTEWGYIPPQVVSFPTPNYAYTYPYFHFDNRMIISLAPHYQFYFKKASLKVGLQLDFLAGNEKYLFGGIVNPGLLVEYNQRVADSTYLRVDIKGGLKDPSYRKMFAECPYLLSLEQPHATYVPLDARVSASNSTLPGFRAEIVLGFKVTINDPFFVSTYDPGHKNLYNYLSTVYQNTGQFYWGINLDYRYRDIVDLSFRVQNNYWSVGLNHALEEEGIPLSVAWQKPAWEIGLEAGFHVTKGLRLGVSHNMMLGRVAFDPFVSTDRAAAPSVAKMTDMHDLGISASYQINDRWGIYLQGANLLGIRYENHYGYPVQPFHVMAGVTFRF